ncbi:MAG: hypothetical protein JWM80_1568 [Cyanobacteria bacterium RYN_339]|nr:hypothetical protein [Cyanobacteria bacterium RYN_339]
MSISPITKWATYAAIAMILPGCGSTTGLLAAQTNFAGGAAADPNGQHAGRGGDHGKGGGKGGFGLPGVDVADLALTADQQTALKAVMDKYKPSAPAAKPSGDPGAALKAAVTADKVDDATLRAAIAAMEANRPAAPKVDRTAMLTEVRAILTDDQRAKIVAKLQAGPTDAKGSPRPAPSGAPADRLAALNLTAEQKAAVDALEAARKPAGAPADRNAAMIAFWQSGDTTGLAEPARPAFPTELFVAAVEILDVTQRKALFGQERGHGGPGGDRGMGNPEQG